MIVRIVGCSEFCARNLQSEFGSSRHLYLISVRTIHIAVANFELSLLKNDFAHLSSLEFESFHLLLKSAGDR